MNTGALILLLAFALLNAISGWMSYLVAGMVCDAAKSLLRDDAEGADE